MRVNDAQRVAILLDIRPQYAARLGIGFQRIDEARATVAGIEYRVVAHIGATIDHRTLGWNEVSVSEKLMQFVELTFGLFSLNHIRFILDVKDRVDTLKTYRCDVHSMPMLVSLVMVAKVLWWTLGPTALESTVVTTVVHGVSLGICIGSKDFLMLTNELPLLVGSKGLLSPAGAPRNCISF